MNYLPFFFFPSFFSLVFYHANHVGVISKPASDGGGGGGEGGGQRGGYCFFSLVGEGLKKTEKVIKISPNDEVDSGTGPDDWKRVKAEESQ